MAVGEEPNGRMGKKDSEGKVVGAEVEKSGGWDGV